MHGEAQDGERHERGDDNGEKDGEKREHDDQVFRSELAGLGGQCLGRQFSGPGPGGR